MTMDQLHALTVEPFKLSTTRPQIWAGMARLASLLIDGEVKGELVVDGSFLTDEIDPLDVDLVLVVTPIFYEGAIGEPLRLMEWIRDDATIKDSHLCDCSLCVEYPKGHEQYFDGIQDRQSWVNLFAKSVVFKRERGLAVVDLKAMP